MSYEHLNETDVLGDRSSLRRKVWMSSPELIAPQRAILFLDGELYIERVNAPQVVRRLQAAHSLPPVLCIYVSCHGAAARHADFTCNMAYADFVAHDVIAWLTHRFPDLNQFVLAGLSLSGLAAASLAIQFPKVFRNVICQSPSFWWKQEQFRSMLPRAQGTEPEFWISVGDRELDTNVIHPPTGLLQQATQVESCERTCDALRSLGYRASLRTFSGGHDPICWREDLMLALPWAWRTQTHHDEAASPL
jgi:enterochelin esterase family protein